MRPHAPAAAANWGLQHAAPQMAVLRAPARALLQTNQAPQVGGFQAARYFTYVFFALAISVVLVMIFLCTMHCYRRARRQQEIELQSTRAPVVLPEVNIQIEPQREQAAPPPKPLNVYDAVLVRHPDGSKEVAYAPAIVARVLQPELTAAQKAMLRRSTRINSISRYEAGDSRARRRRQALEASLVRSRSGGIGAHMGPDEGPPFSTGDLLRGWSMEGAELLYASHRTASAGRSRRREQGDGRAGGAGDSPDQSPSLAPHPRRGSARRGSSRQQAHGQQRQQLWHGGSGDGSITAAQLAALHGIPGDPPHTLQSVRHDPRSGPGSSGLELPSSSSSGNSDSGDEWGERGARRRPQSAGSLSSRLHRHVRRHRHDAGSGNHSRQQ